MVELLKTAGIVVALIAAFCGLVWKMRDRIFGAFRTGLLDVEKGIIPALKTQLYDPLVERIANNRREMMEKIEDAERDRAELRDDVKHLRLLVENVILAVNDRARYRAKDAYQQNSPHQFRDVKKLLKQFGHTPPDLVEAGQRIIADGPLPDDDPGLMVRIALHIPPARQLERANQLKKPLDEYQAICCDMLRLIRDWPGGYAKFVEDMTTPEPEGDGA